MLRITPLHAFAAILTNRPSLVGTALTGKGQTYSETLSQAE